MSEDKNYEVGFKKPPRKSQFKKGRSGNPWGRPRKYSIAEERELLRSLVCLMEEHTDKFSGNTRSRSFDYILWLLKELEIQIRLQAHDRILEVKPPDNDDGDSRMR